MRRSTAIGRRISNPNSFISNPSSKHSPFLSSYPFSSSSGRGRGSPSNFNFTGPGKPELDHPKPDLPESQPAGVGRGRGRIVPANPVLPSFSSFISSAQSNQPGSGRGRVNTESGPSRPAESPAHSSQKPESKIPSDIQSALSGAGRGKTVERPSRAAPEIEENRHVRTQPKPKPKAVEAAGPPRPKLSREEAVKEAMRVLSEGGGGGSGPGRGRGRGRGERVRGRGRGRGRGLEARGRREREEDRDEGYAAGLYLGDNADGEKLAERIGLENMNKLTEGFEEMSGRVLPSPVEEAYLDALDTNFKIEFEPEWLMGEFDQNPEIDEKPPMPIRDVLEKLKPFLMAYEGMQSQEEWEAAVEETMKNVPLLKAIVDEYGGPDRVSAKTQQEELERVAKTIPASAPASVKRFTDRAVLSLQDIIPHCGASLAGYSSLQVSNPGWGFDKKCQFMDKLVREVSQHYSKG